MIILRQNAYELYSMLPTFVINQTSQHLSKSGQEEWEVTQQTSSKQFYEFFTVAVKVAHRRASVLMAHNSSISATNDTIMHAQTTGATTDKPKADPPLPTKPTTMEYEEKETKENGKQDQKGRTMNIQPPAG